DAYSDSVSVFLWRRGVTRFFPRHHYWGGCRHLLVDLYRFAHCAVVVAGPRPRRRFAPPRSHRKSYGRSKSSRPALRALSSPVHGSRALPGAGWEPCPASAARNLTSLSGPSRLRVTVQDGIPKFGE